MIEIRNINKTFKTKDLTVQACKDVSLSIGDSEIYGVIGYSGAGKSTLVRCINFLEIPSSGEVEIKGFGTITSRNGKLYYRSPEGKEVICTEKHLKKLRQGIGMIFQHFNLLDRSTVYENIAYPLKHKGKSKKEIDERVRELLALVDLSDKIASYPSELSGGQKQRVAIARALANNPKILLSDEATSALDPDATESILNLLKKLNKELGLTIVLITHEMAVIKSLAQRIAVMENGQVVEQGNVYDIFSNPQQKITRNFVNASSGLADIQELLDQKDSVIKPKADSQLVKLVFNKECVGDAIISETSIKFNVKLNIITANIELLQGNPLGTMMVYVEGEKDSVQGALTHLEKCHVKVKVIENERID